MKKFLTLALMTMMVLSATAAKKKEAAKDANKPVFTIIKENPITSMKDQNRSGIFSSMERKTSSLKTSNMMTSSW